VRYFAEISRHLQTAAEARHTAPVRVDVYAGFHHLRNAAQLFHETHFHGAYLPRFRGSWRIARLVNECWLTAALGKGAEEPTVLHETYYGNRVALRRNVARLVTIHDMIPEDTSAGTESWLIRAKKRSIAAADGLIFVSQATRRRFLNYYDGRKPYAVIHHAGSLRIQRARRDIGMPWPFILYVGARGKYKNWSSLIAAMTRDERLKDYGLVCTGPDLDEEDRRTLHTLGFPPQRMRHLRGDDDVLADLYSHAACFVYPSLQEGFGIPLLEAATLGCPIACSDIEVFREVIGEAAHFFDPNQPDQISNAIVDALAEGRESEITQRAHIRAAGFSWARAAAETLAFYRSLA
jgi:glycosyltransferase involved in cell wall biosynthesis